MPLINANPVTAVDDFIEKRFNVSAPYPNPAQHTTTLPFYINSPGIVDIRLLDIQGRFIRKIIGTYHQPGKYNVDVNLGDLKSGSYYIQFRHNNLRKTQKIIVSR